MKMYRTLLFILGLLLLGAPLAHAEELTNATEIVRRASLAAYYTGDDGRSQARMTIVDAQGRERRRQFTVLRKDIEDGGDQHFLLVFSRPADVRKTGFLVAKHVGKDDDRWLYLPGLDLVKRIAAGDERTSFVGSDYFYEDISGRGIDEDEHTLVGSTDDCYQIQSTPKDPSSVEFARYEVCVGKDDFLPRKIDYFDEQDELYRSVEALEIKEIGGYPSVTRGKVSNLRSGGYTITEFRGIEYNLGIPESVFTERSLRNPPNKWFGKSK